jgi:hypothetical protein
VVLEDVLVNHCDGDVTPCRSPNYAIAIDTVLVLGAMALDDARFARAPIPATRDAERTVSPGLLVGPSTAFVSLGGAFDGYAAMVTRTAHQSTDASKTLSSL